MTKRILLSPEPTTKMWKIKMWFARIGWKMHKSPTKKSWENYYYSMIPHKCEYDYSNIIRTDMWHCKCKHHGCNFSTIKDEDDEYYDPELRELTRPLR